MISHVMTLANGIIGVSVLAMPYCFKQCGIVLATLMLVLSSMLSRLACHFLIKSAVITRRRNFEFLAFHTFGPMGKFLVELCIIGFLLGTCIAFFVVVGDLGPQIIGQMIKRSPDNIRTSFLITTGIFIVLPLGLLRNIDSLASVNTASIAFYICLVLKVIAESTHHIFTADWFDKIHYWRPEGLLQCLPIFALALFCQTQLFEIYEAIPNASLEKMNQVVRGALNICTAVYICVGFFGYIAFCTQTFTGNILISFEPSLTSEIIKIGFVLSVAFSFPLVIFPCRASLNSLLFKRGYAHETSTSYISETRFRCLTTFIVTISLIVGVLIPNIEFVLGIIGSTIGVIICLIFPAAFFISISTKNTNERLLAQIIVVIGFWIMLLGTYANLYAIEQSSNFQAKATTVKFPSQINNIPHVLINNEMLIRADEPKQLDHLLNLKGDIEKPNIELPHRLDEENVRQEPPIPVERLPENDNLKDKPEIIVLEPVTINLKIHEAIDNDLIKKVTYDLLKEKKENNDLSVKQEKNLEAIKENEKSNLILKNDIAADAIKKEDFELAAEKELSNVDSVQTKKKLKDTLKKHSIEEKNLMKEKKELLKDTEQINRELQLAEKELADKKNYEIINTRDKVIGEPIPIQMEQEKFEIENKNNENNGKNKINILEKEIKPLENKEPVLDLQNLQNKQYHENNQITIDVDNKQKLKSDEGSKSNKQLPLGINLSHVPANLSIKKSENPIIIALTKQSNKISNDIPKSNVINNVFLESNPNNKKNEKNDEYSIPIVLKMNNQTKFNSESGHQKVNLSLAKIEAVKRDILEEHQRDKRMVETEENDLHKANSNGTVKEYEDDPIVDQVVVKEHKVCMKKEKELQSESSKKKIEYENISEKKNSQNLLKTSVHLSEQDIIKKVVIDSDLTDLSAVGNFVTVKKRDLKALKFENENEK